MSKHFNWDRIVAFASWIIVALLLYGVLFILFHDLNPTSPIVKALGEPLTRSIFISLYGVQGVLLGYSKWFKKDKLRRHTLLFIYLTGFFLSILGFLLNGINIRLVANMLMSTCAAICWIYWKFKTDYMSHEEAAQFNEEEMD